MIIFIYGPSILGENLWSDDGRLMALGSDIQAQPTVKGFAAAWSNGFFMQEALLWRPLGLWSFQLGNLAPEVIRLPIQHGIQLLIAMALAMALHGFCRNVCRASGIGGQYGPWVGTLLVSSPFLVESTAWISARFDLLLATFCCLLASSAMKFWEAKDFKESRGALLGCVCFAWAALLSKESAPFGIAVALSCSLLAFQGQLKAKRLGILLLAMLTTMAIWFAAYSSAVDLGRMATLPRVVEWDVAGWALSGYASYLAFPWAVHSTGHLIPLGLPGLRHGVGLAMFGLLTGAMLWCFASKRIRWGLWALLGIGCLIFMAWVAACDPRRGIMGEFFMSERYAMALLPLMACAWMGILRCIKRWRVHDRWVLWSALACIMLSGLISIMAVHDYSTKRSYWSSMGVLQSSKAARIYGAELWNQKKYKAALDAMLGRIQILDESMSPWASGKLQWNQELIADAMDLLIRAGYANQAIEIGHRWIDKGQAQEPIFMIQSMALAREGRCQEARIGMRMGAIMAMDSALDAHEGGHSKERLERLKKMLGSLCKE